MPHEFFKKFFLSVGLSFLCRLQMLVLENRFSMSCKVMALIPMEASLGFRVEN
jgi:hypothetical protein